MASAESAWSALKGAWKARVLDGLRVFAEMKGFDPASIDGAALVPETPPDPALGDQGYPMFAFAKAFRMAPPLIAKELAALLAAPDPACPGTASSEGPYLNIRFGRDALTGHVLEEAVREGYGDSASLRGRKVMIEFSSPNTNKPLHLGHLRNDALGESMARILAANGAELRKVSIVNDRGVHICKSMLAYERAGKGSTPESEGVKGDHFVGRYYVEFARWAKEDPSAEEQAREMLRRWEAGDPEVRALWRTMRDWVLAGMAETYRRTGISFDRYYYESETFELGRDIVLEGLARGVFYKEADGSVWLDAEAIGLDKKVFLRADGTSIYITQDLGTAVRRHEEWPFDQLIYVVASEQQYHFKVLFHALERLGYPWAANLFHLSYGMVNLPEGRMKSREGTVVDADDLIDELKALALEEIRMKGREGELRDAEATAEGIAIGALHYYLLQASRSKDMVFNPKESLSFAGDTGPYLQYTGSRISSVLRKAAELGLRAAADPSLLSGDEEWALAKLVAGFPEAVESAAREMDPSIVAAWLYDAAKGFSRYYRDNPIATHPDARVASARLALAEALLACLKKGMGLIAVPFLEEM
jgi:arginyl-tRNA synthetase